MLPVMMIWAGWMPVCHTELRTVKGDRKTFFGTSVTFEVSKS